MEVDMRVARRRETDRRVVVTIILVIWLVIGLAAAVQRGYFSNEYTNCSEVSSTLVTVVAGPLNYVGANPRINCEAPQPSR